MRCEVKISPFRYAPVEMTIIEFKFRIGIKETSYLEGDFTLRSGKKSKYYLDKYLFETHPDILKALGEEFTKHVQMMLR